MDGLVWGNLVDVQPIEGKIAAGEPVILKGEAGVYSFAPTTGAVKAERNDTSHHAPIHIRLKDPTNSQSTTVPYLPKMSTGIKTYHH